MTTIIQQAEFESTLVDGVTYNPYIIDDTATAVIIDAVVADTISNMDLITPDSLLSEVSATNKIITQEDLTTASSDNMLKAGYDSNDSGVVDNAELVNGLTVETAVPLGATFTDTVYDSTDVDTHILDGTKHFTKESITITESQITDLGDYEIADTTILKDADIGVTVQPYDADTVKDSNYIHTDKNFTQSYKDKLDGIDDNANEYELPVGGSVIGGVKSGLDIDIDVNGEMTLDATRHTHPIDKVVGLQDALDLKLDVVHTHIIDDVAGLQNALNAKSDTSHTHNLESIIDVEFENLHYADLLFWDGDMWHNTTLEHLGIETGNVYLTENQTITLSGDATGSGTTDITVTVGDDSHSHTLATLPEGVTCR